MCMHALGINSQFCMGDSIASYMFAKFGPPWGTIFGKGGPLLAAKIGPGAQFCAKIGPGDRFWCDRAMFQNSTLYAPIF